jgi:hypothetical protein
MLQLQDFLPTAYPVADLVPFRGILRAKNLWSSRRMLKVPSGFFLNVELLIGPTAKVSLG